MPTSELLSKIGALAVCEPAISEMIFLSARTYQLCVFTMHDYEQVIDLWLRTGISVGSADSREGILHTLQRNPDLFLVAVSEKRVVGTVIGTYDGRCGWANHVAVDPQWQGAGVGQALMRELENRLRARGCSKMNLTVKRSNAQVQGFYERLGFDSRDVIFMQKCL
jgi:ribosomal protein S18 acetylase RimI-like enzyme